MDWPAIRKSVEETSRANLRNYDEECAAFDWDRARTWLAGLPHAAGLNIAYEAVDRHVDAGDGDHVALRIVHADESVTAYTYRQLSRDSARFANVLQTLGVGAGERVVSLLGRRYETFVTLLGTLKNRSVLSPLFTAYGPDPVRRRLELSEARVLVTTRSQYRRKVASVRAELTELKHVLLVDADDEPDTLGYALLMSAARDSFTIPDTSPEDMALLHFTSGTTGTPKGAVHVHEAVVAHFATGRYALDLHPDDVFWCTADPGWVTGTSYGVISPLTHGATLVVDEADFDAARWWRILASERVNVWYTAPTALRMLMQTSAAPARDHDLSALRFIASVGEPLNPEVVVWGAETLGLPVHDNWWQTETGGIMVANFAACDIFPGSMGRPLPGVTATVVAANEDGAPIVDGETVRLVTAPDEVGILALKRGWPSMFRGYLHDDARYATCFRNGWYLTGDLVRRDAAGWFWFVGRADDVIKTAGHLVSPFEVESGLLEHPAVAEAGVVGKPDALVGTVVKAYVTLRPPYEPTKSLRLELIGFARKKLGAGVAPRDISFADELPHTESGKIMRRLLKEWP